MLVSCEEIGIAQNAAIPPEHRAVFVQLFRTVCPSFVEHRWEYVFETLEWLLPRKHALSFMSLRDLAERDDKEMSHRELDLLGDLTAAESMPALRFWATAALAKQLADWGHRVSGVLHGCPCHPRGRTDSACRSSSSSSSSISNSSNQCPMAGRMAVPLAVGLMDWAQSKLSDSVLKPPTQAALNEFSNKHPEEAQTLLRSWQLTVSRMRARASQVFSYWGELPWALLAVMRPFVETFHSQQEAGLVSCSNITYNPTYLGSGNSRAKYWVRSWNLGAANAIHNLLTARPISIPPLS